MVVGEIIGGAVMVTLLTKSSSKSESGTAWLGLGIIGAVVAGLVCWPLAALLPAASTGAFILTGIPKVIMGAGGLGYCLS